MKHRIESLRLQDWILKLSANTSASIISALEYTSSLGSDKVRQFSHIIYISPVHVFVYSFAEKLPMPKASELVEEAVPYH